MSDQAVQMLADDWRHSGVAAGDMLLLHSSIKRTLKRIGGAGSKPSPSIILDSLLVALGDEGTLLLPLFNWGFPKGEPFDIRSTPSQMGSLAECGRLHPGAVRTGHPIYSFAVLGKRAPMFKDVRNFSGYGSDSPFALLHREGGKIAVLDLPDQQSMTFYHYVEECHEVPYRYHKEFTGDYTDNKGRTSRQTFGLFVRDI